MDSNQAEDLIRRLKIRESEALSETKITIVQGRVWDNTSLESTATVPWEMLPLEKLTKYCIHWAELTYKERKVEYYPRLTTLLALNILNPSSSAPIFTPLPCDASNKLTWDLLDFEEINDHIDTMTEIGKGDAIPETSLEIRLFCDEVNQYCPLGFEKAITMMCACLFRLAGRKAENSLASLQSSFTMRLKGFYQVSLKEHQLKLILPSLPMLKFLTSAFAAGRPAVRTLLKHALLLIANPQKDTLIEGILNYSFLMNLQFTGLSIISQTARILQKFSIPTIQTFLISTATYQTATSLKYVDYFWSTYFDPKSEFYNINLPVLWSRVFDPKYFANFNNDSNLHYLALTAAILEDQVGVGCWLITGLDKLKHVQPHYDAFGREWKKKYGYTSTITPSRPEE